MAAAGRPFRGLHCRVASPPGLHARLARGLGQELFRTRVRTTSDMRWLDRTGTFPLCARPIGFSKLPNARLARRSTDRVCSRAKAPSSSVVTTGEALVRAKADTIRLLAAGCSCSATSAGPGSGGWVRSCSRRTASAEPTSLGSRSRESSSSAGAIYLSFPGLSEQLNTRVAVGLATGRRCSPPTTDSSGMPSGAGHPRLRQERARGLDPPRLRRSLGRRGSTVGVLQPALRLLGNRRLEAPWHCLIRGRQDDEATHVANRTRAAQRATWNGDCRGILRTWAVVAFGLSPSQAPSSWQRWPSAMS